MQPIPNGEPRGIKLAEGFVARQSDDIGHPDKLYGSRVFGRIVGLSQRTRTAVAVTSAVIVETSAVRSDMAHSLKCRVLVDAAGDHQTRKTEHHPEHQWSGYTSSRASHIAALLQSRCSGFGGSGDDHFRGKLFRTRPHGGSSVSLGLFGLVSKCACRIAAAS